MRKLKKILFVEDDKSIALVAKIIFEKHNYEVHHFFNASEAIENYIELNPQLIISDMMMPEIDGVEFFKILKEKYDSTTPFVFMTARAQVHEQKQYLELGALGVIVKPFDPAKICLELEQLWENYNQKL